MKKTTVAAIAAIVFCLPFALSACSTNPRKVFEKNTGVKIPSNVHATTIDTTDGPFGDGEILYTFYLNKGDENAFETAVTSAAHWLPLPLTREIETLVYEHFSVFSARAEHGYYFFRDEQNDKYYLPENYEETFYSYDFVFALYDSAESVAYYYEQHT